MNFFTFFCFIVQKAQGSLSRRRRRCELGISCIC